MGDYAIGLKYDGSLLSAKWFVEKGCPDRDYGQANVGNWKNVVKCICGYNRTVCVKRDGPVLAVGYSDNHGVNNVSSFDLFDDIETFEEEVAANEEEA